MLDDDLTFTVQGRPLSELGLEDARIIDASGKDIGPLTGFVVWPGQTVEEAIKAALPPGCSLRHKPRLH